MGWIPCRVVGRVASGTALGGGEMRSENVRRSGIAGVLSIAAFVLAFASLPAPAQEPAEPGFRVYVFVLDGMEPQEVNPVLTPNLAELKSQGTWYEEARAVFPAETLPNHAAMMTGVLPERNGIIGNQYGYFFPGIYRDLYMDNPSLLDADTLITRLEDCCPQISTATALSKGYLYNLFHGEPYIKDDPNDPDNQRQADYHWNPQTAPGYIDYPDGHIPDQGTMNEGLLPWIRSNAPTPQFAFINLGDVDRSGHVDETGISGEVSAFRQAAIEDTDALIGQFVDELKSSGAWDETVLILTSDHGMDWSLNHAPLLSSDIGPDAAHAVDVSRHLFLAGYNAYAIPGGGSAAVYTREQGAALRIPREITATDADIPAMARVMSAHPGVAFVATPESIPDLDNPTLHEMGMDHPDNGHLVVFVKPGWAVRDNSSTNPLPGNHGHPATQHSVLLVTGGHPSLDDTPESVPGEKVYDPENKLFSPPADGPGNLSIAPTVAALFGIGEPVGGYDGAPLREAFEPYAFVPHTPGTAPPALPDVTLEQADDPDPVKVARTLTYTLAVENTGAADATGVRVVDDLPATVTPGAIVASQGGCSRVNQTVTCELGQLAAGGQATVTIKVKPKKKGTILNTAAVSLNETDLDPSNNRDTEATQVQ